MTYSIVRFNVDPEKNGQVIKSGLTLAQAKKHCKDPKTRLEGVWFDGYRED